MSDIEYSDLPLSKEAIQYVKEMSGWIKFIGIAGVICGAFLSFLAIYTAVNGFVLYFLGFGITVFLCLFLAIKLLKSGILFGTSAKGHDLRKFEQGVALQKSFWRIYGILMLILMVVIVLLLVYVSTMFSDFGPFF